jgi:hypothetical protein
MQLEYFSFGDGAMVLDIPQPTLRNWCDKLEEMGVHYIVRNERNERVLYDIDIAIFKFMKVEKEKNGRNATLQFLGLKLIESMMERRQSPTSLNTSLQAFDRQGYELQRVLESDAFKATVGAIARETAATLEETLTPRIREEVTQSFKAEFSSYEERVNSRLDERAKQTDEFIGVLRQSNRYKGMSIWRRIWILLFGEKTAKS